MPDLTQESRRRRSDAVERLFVLWIVSTLLIVVSLAIVTVFMAGQLRAQSQAVSTLNASVATLEQRLSAGEEQRSALAEALRRQASQPVSVPATSPADVQPAPQPHDAEQVDQARVQAALDALLVPGDALPWTLADPIKAEALLESLAAGSPEPGWEPSTWLRLALVARLASADESAASFAALAERGGVSLAQYFDLSARVLLDRGDLEQARAFAMKLVGEASADQRAWLVLASIEYRRNDLAAADGALAHVLEPASLDAAERVSLGRMLVAVERWDRLRGVTELLRTPPAELLGDVNMLRAVMAIVDGKYAAALAILDSLLESRPEDYDLLTWRGVALLKAGQFGAARDALSHTADVPGRPEAWYWRGRIEMEAGNPDQAVKFLQSALAASRRFAPAWEALGSLALNRGDLPAAITNFATAVEVNPRRAQAHLFLAVAHAKASDRAAAQADLRNAFQLDATLLDTARRIEVITRLFSDDELAVLAPAGEPAASPSSSSAPSP